jgi:hypothetical protein
VQLGVIALQLRRKVAHRSQPPIVGHRDPASAQIQHHGDAFRELAERFPQVVLRRQNHGES